MNVVVFSPPGLWRFRFPWCFGLDLAIIGRSRMMTVGLWCLCARFARAPLWRCLLWCAAFFLWCRFWRVPAFFFGILLFLLSLCGLTPGSPATAIPEMFRLGF